MAGKTIWFSNQTLRLVRGESLQPFASGAWVALYTTLPGEDGTGGVEVTGGGYVRKQVTFGSAPSNGTLTNTADVVWSAATASWGTIVGFGILDASTAGNLAYADLLKDSQNNTVTKVVGLDDEMKIPSGTLILTEQ